MGRIRSTNRAELPVHEVPPEADALLTNWGRWNAPRHGCGRRTSPHFRLVKPDRWGDWRDPGAPPRFASPPDVDEAWAVEKIICSPAFWPPARALLTNHYTFGMSPGLVCQLLHIERRAFDVELWRAACMFLTRWHQVHGKTVE